MIGMVGAREGACGYVDRPVADGGYEKIVGVEVLGYILRRNPRVQVRGGTSPPIDLRRRRRRQREIHCNPRR